MPSLVFRRRSLARLLYLITLLALARFLFFSSSRPSFAFTSSERSDSNNVNAPSWHQIRRQGVLDLVSAGSDKLDVQKHGFLQVRIGRDESPDFFTDVIMDGMRDFWERFQQPYITDKLTSHMDQQNVLSSIEQLLTLNGWVAALCPTLSRPFGQSYNAYSDLTSSNHLYFVGMVIHSADHFLVDQLALIVQLARRLGSQRLFVSMLDYASADATATLLDLSEAVLTLLGVPFRIRSVPPMTHDPHAAYYPLEEAYTRNLVLEPLYELRARRGVEFDRVIWLKGFTCPNDILETIVVARKNDAALVCGMDWAQHSGFFIFSDRWRTRDINGDQFRQAKSVQSSPSSGPPRDSEGAARYAKHLPFQVFCCESGTHVVDPRQTYYSGLRYRAGMEYGNLSTTEPARKRPPDAPCLDSTQAYFCRDLWVAAAREGMKEIEEREGGGGIPAGNANGAEGRGRLGFGLDFDLRWRSWKKTTDAPAAAETYRHQQEPRQEERMKASYLAKRADGVVGVGGGHAQRQRVKADADANVGSDYDAMPDTGEDDENNPGHNGKDEGGTDVKALIGDDNGFDDRPSVDTIDDLYDDDPLSIPNSVFRPARILVNPRCVTTYAGVSHAQLALDLFGPDKDKDLDVEDADDGIRDYGLRRSSEKYVLDDWEGAPESFVCQEQRFTGGRIAPKTQRRLGFSIHAALEDLE